MESWIRAHAVAATEFAKGIEGFTTGLSGTRVVLRTGIEQCHLEDGMAVHLPGIEASIGCRNS